MGCSGRRTPPLRRWEELGIWDWLDAELLRLVRQDDKLDPDLVIVDGVIVRAFGGGEKTGPSPVDRRKRAPNHRCWWTDTGYLWPSARRAQRQRPQQIIPLVLDFPQIGGEAGRPKELPNKLYATMAMTAAGKAGS